MGLDGAYPLHQHARSSIRRSSLGENEAPRQLSRRRALSLPPVPTTSSGFKPRDNEALPMDATCPSLPRAVPLKRGGAVPSTSLFVAYRLPPGRSDAESTVRSLYPLGSIEKVFVIDFGREESVWVVGSEHASSLGGHLRVAGRQIHFRPKGVFRPHTQPTPVFRMKVVMRHLDDPIIFPIDPRFPPTDDRVFAPLREALPFVVGLRIYQYGEVELLVEGTPDKVLPVGEWPLTIGELPYFVTAIVSTRKTPSAASHTISYGTKISSDDHHGGGAHRSGACLGVKIKGPDGVVAITAVTHGFIPAHLPPTFAARLSDAFLAVPRLLCRTLLYYIPRIPIIGSYSESPLVTDYPITSCSKWAYKMQVPILGTSVYCSCIDDCTKKRADIGVVGAVFDFPSASQPYPNGYLHDLSLLYGTSLPEIVALPLLPRLSCFVPYERVFEMRDRAVFTVSFPYVGSDELATSGHLLTGKTVDIITRESLVAGMEVMFTGDQGKQSAAILWRTKAKYRFEPEIVVKTLFGDGNCFDAVGFSGSVLCVGPETASACSSSLIPPTAEVLCFQNYETLLPQAFAPPASTLPPTIPTYKGGFRLPKYVYNSEIMMAGGILM